MRSKGSLPCVKICISLPPESMTQLSYLADHLSNPISGICLPRSTIIAACIADVYERVVIEESKK